MFVDILFLFLLDIIATTIIFFLGYVTSDEFLESMFYQYNIQFKSIYYLEAIKFLILVINSYIVGVISALIGFHWILGLIIFISGYLFQSISREF